jgi:UDP-N-acetylmuramate dehydrogenase
MIHVMKVEHQISLKRFNTFGIDVTAPTLLYIQDEHDLVQAIADPSLKGGYLLGGGSNVLFCHAPQKSIWYNQLQGREILHENTETATIKVKSGENWHDFVMWTLEQGYYGLENLALIPGTLGAAPIQNIGAYGVELKDFCLGVEAFDLGNGLNKWFAAESCVFGYRSSIFKGIAKGQYFITAVHLQLSKIPKLNTSYGVIEKQLHEKGISSPTPHDVAHAVIKIRRSKLPDPTLIGNAGSFFKNPSVSSSQFKALKEAYPNLVAYPNPDGTHKLAAAWLIESGGWKGFRNGDAGCFEKQALVLVNHGNATGNDIWDLALQIIESVKHKFGVTLEPEVNIL